MSQIIIIDGKQIQTMDDFHHIISEKLNFPSFYGKNLDALWDCLTGFSKQHCILVWENYSFSKLKLGKDFEKIITLFDEVKKEQSSFQYELR